MSRSNTWPFLNVGLEEAYNADFGSGLPEFEEAISLFVVNQQAQSAQSAVSFLTDAAAVMTERAKEYDCPDGERSMENTVVAFNAITGHNLTESDGWLFMQVLKDVRQWSARDFHEDSAKDCIAYAALKAEALANAK